MRILLTGHKGYIGSVAGPMLRSAGHDVIGLDSDLFEGCDFGAGPEKIPEIRKDLRDVVPADLRGLDAVVHLAALSNDPLGDLSRDLTYEINYTGSIRLALAAKEARVRRFVFSSSCSTYGAAGGESHDETGVPNPVTAYAESKVMVERDLSRMADRTFSPTHLRNATAYGVSSRLRLDVVLNDLVAWAYTTGRVFIKSDGTPWRPIVHIEDIASAIISVLAAPLEVVHNETFNVGQTEENYRIKELAEIVAEAVPGCSVTYARDGGPDKRCYRVNFDKLRNVLSFQPTWNARRGVQQLHDAYRSVGLTFSDIDRGRYVRISHIKRLIATGRLDESLRWSEPTGSPTAAQGSEGVASRDA